MVYLSEKLKGLQSLKTGSISKDAANTFTIYDDTGLNKTTGRKTPDMSFLEKVADIHFQAAENFRNTLCRTIADNRSVLGISPSTADNGFNFKNDPKRGYFV